MSRDVFFSGNGGMAQVARLAVEACACLCLLRVLLLLTRIQRTRSGRRLGFAEAAKGSFSRLGGGGLMILSWWFPDLIFYRGR